MKLSYCRVLENGSIILWDEENKQIPIVATVPDMIKYHLEQMGHDTSEIVFQDSEGNDLPQ